MLPTLRQLEYLVAVAETGQFQEAARRCAVSQPALSKQVREVEQLLGVEIFERTRPRVLVTQVGQEIVRRARQLLGDAHELVDVAHASTRLHRGTVRIGVIPTIAPYGLPGLLAKLRALFPEVSFAIAELQTEVLLERLRSGAIDIGLLARAFDDDGLRGLDLVVEPFVLVAPGDHPLGKAAPITAREIAGASLILMEDGHCLRDQAMAACRVKKLEAVNSFAASSLLTLLAMVDGDLGVTLLPEMAVGSSLLKQTRIRTWPLQQGGHREIALVWRHNSARAEEFRELGESIRALVAPQDKG